MIVIGDLVIADWLAALLSGLLAMAVGGTLLYWILRWRDPK